MKVELIHLELTNYRNIEYASYDFDGNSKIVGDNRIGKTNTLEAIVWLLSDKLLNGSSDVMSIKPTKDPRKEVRVEGTFRVGDRTITLRKEYGEDWVKTRGTEFETLRGHYLIYYYNGVKQKTKKDYYALFNEDFGFTKEYKGIDLVQLLTNPYYIGDLGEGDGWTDLRAFIIDLIGDVSDEDVFAAQPSTMLIKEELRACGNRIDQLKKQYTNEIKALKEQIIGDDANIKLLEETECPSNEDVIIANKGKIDIEEQIVKLQNDKGNESAILEFEKQIIEKKQQLMEHQAKGQVVDTTSELAQKLATLNEEYRALLIEKTDLMGEESRAKASIDQAKVNVTNYSNIRKALIEQLRDLDREFAAPFDAICPTCGQPLEGEHLTKAKEERDASINQRKAAILERGKTNRQLLDEATQVALGGELDAINERMKELLKRIEDKKEEITRVNDELIVEKGKPREIKEDSFAYALKQVIKDLETKRDIAKADLNAANANINEMIEKLLTQKKVYTEVLNKYDYAQIQKERAEMVKQQRQNHSIKVASYEQKKELIDLFMKVKLDMLDEKVKSVFDGIRFQLVSANLKEGSFNPICKPYIYNIDKGESTNVSWRNGSKSERVITGIAIAEKIKEHLGLYDLPYMFDEGGEISTDTFETKFKTESQLICVKVMDNIKHPTIMKI